MTSRSIPANATALVSARVFMAAAAIIVAAVAARQLGEEGFGTYAAVVIAGFLANTVVTFGTDTLVVRSLARGEDHTDIRRSVGLQLSIVSVIVVAAAIGVAVVGERAIPLLIQAAGLVAGVWATAAGAVLRGRERMDLTAISTTAGALVTVAGALVAGSVDGSVGAFVLAVVIGQVVAAISAVALATRLMPMSTRLLAWSPTFDLTFWTDARPFATMVGASAVAASVGVLSLQLFGNNINTGHFAAANRVAEGLRLIPAAAFGASFPAMSRQVHLTARYANGVKVLLVATTAVAALTVLWADPIVDVVFDDFEEAAQILRILALGLVPLVIRLRWSFELIAEGAQDAVAHLAVSAAAVTVILCIVSAIRWGPTMVATSTVIGLTFHAVSLWHLRRRTVALTN